MAALLHLNRLFSAIQIRFVLIVGMRAGIPWEEGNDPDQHQQRCGRWYTQRPHGTLMAADAGIAVLALIKLLPFDAQTFCRRPIDL